MRALALTAAATAMILVAGCGKKDDAAATNTAGADGSTTSLAAANADAPAPGLWEITTKVAGQATPAVKICLGETPAGSNPFNGAQSGDCTGSAPTKTATGYEFASSCTSGGQTVNVKGSVSGDMATKFTVNAMTTVGGKDIGAETTYTRISDCAAGTAPNTVVQ